MKICLENIKRQKYDGGYTITVIDSDSTDMTQSIAYQFNCKVFINKGMWGFGKNGARIFGERVTNNKFIWVLDSDNYFFDPNSLRRMVYELITHPEVNIAVPVPVPSNNAACKLNNYLSIQERLKILSSITDYEPENGNMIVKELTYRMPNAVLIRRETLEAVGGYDKDTWLLTRLREKDLASAIIMTNVHFEHDQILGPKDYLNKWEKRVNMYYHNLSGKESEYFIDAPQRSYNRKNIYRAFIKGLMQHPIIGMRLIKDRDLNGIWGLIFPFLILSLFIVHPIKGIRVGREFL